MKSSFPKPDISAVVKSSVSYVIELRTPNEPKAAHVMRFVMPPVAPRVGEFVDYSTKSRDLEGKVLAVRHYLKRSDSYDPYDPHEVECIVQVLIDPAAATDLFEEPAPESANLKKGMDVWVTRKRRFKYEMIVAGNRRFYDEQPVVPRQGDFINVLGNLRQVKSVEWLFGIHGPSSATSISADVRITVNC